MEKIKIYVGGNIETLNKVFEKLTKLGYRYTGTIPEKLNVNNDAVYAGGMHGPIISFRRFMPKYTFDAVDDGYRRVTVEELMRLESNEFKEYLDPSDWSLKLVGPYEVYPENWIEVPEGMNFAYMHTFRKYVYFVQKKLWFTSHAPVWQRHTQPEPLPFIDDEPRPKPRKRVYAVLGRKVINVTIHVQPPIEQITITGTAIDDDCIRVPKASADYLFNTVQTLSFLSKDQKDSVLHHLNYLKVY